MSMYEQKIRLIDLLSYLEALPESRSLGKNDSAYFYQFPNGSELALEKPSFSEPDAYVTKVNCWSNQVDKVTEFTKEGDFNWELRQFKIGQRRMAFLGHPISAETLGTDRASVRFAVPNMDIFKKLLTEVYGVYAEESDQTEEQVDNRSEAEVSNEVAVHEVHSDDFKDEGADVDSEDSDGTEDTKDPELQAKIQAYQRLVMHNLTAIERSYIQEVLSPMDISDDLKRMYLCIQFGIDYRDFGLIWSEEMYLKNYDLLKALTLMLAAKITERSVG